MRIFILGNVLTSPWQTSSRVFSSGGVISCKGPYLSSRAFLRAAAGSGFLDHPEEFLHIERFRKVSARAGGHEAFDLARGSIRADYHYGDVTGRLIALETGEDFPSRQIGQVEVEQNDIGRMLAGELDAKLSLHCGDELGLRFLGEHLLDESQVREIVFHVKDSALRDIRGIVAERAGVLDRSYPGERRLCTGKLDPEHAAFAERAIRAN